MLRLFGSLLLSLLSPSVLACDCLWQGPFKAVYDNADLLAHVRVEATKGNSADLTFIRDPIPEKEYRESIRLWADTGELCRPEIGQFSEGSEWVIAAQAHRYPARG